MKRFLIVGLVIGIVASSVVTAEAKGTDRNRFERTVQGSYAIQFVPFSVYCYRHAGVGCVEIETRKHEAFLTARAVDAHGQPVLVQVRAKLAGMGPAEWMDYGSFCGETDEPIAFDRGVDLDFVVGNDGGGNDCGPGFGTTGTVSVTLSNLP